MSDPAAIEFRFDELRRALDIQRETVDVLHARANVLLVAALGVAALLGPNATSGSKWGAAIVGAVGLSVTVVAFLNVYRPRSYSWYSNIDQMADRLVDNPTIETVDLRRGSLPAMKRGANKNVETLEAISKWFEIEAVAVVATTVGLLIVTLTR